MITWVARPFGRGSRVHHGGRHPRALAARAAALDQLRAGRHGLGRIAAHAREHGLELVLVMGRLENALQGVAADAVGQERLDPVVAGCAQQPFRVGELADDVLGLLELDVGGRGRAGADIHRLRARQRIAGRPDADGVVAGRQPVGREAELALVVADHRGGDGRAFLPGADQHAFHRAFLGRSDLAAERRGLRLRRGQGHARQCTHETRRCQQGFQSHVRLPRRIVDNRNDLLAWWHIFRPGDRAPELEKQSRLWGANTELIAK
jgi:hypothetical protein